MKTIVETATGLSKYLLDDGVTITVNPGHIVVGDPAEFIIGDLDSSNATVYENLADTPDDWIGNKYVFDVSRSASDQWKLNPDYTEDKE